MRQLTVDSEVWSMSADTRRCAIYVRTAIEIAGEPGLAALDAQRDVCAACIRNQLGASWIASFEDLGFSGFGLKRPALQRLLSDIDAGAIDVVVVFHVDRLTRSARHLAELLARFADAGVSLVVAAGAAGILGVVDTDAAARGGGTP